MLKIVYLRRFERDVKQAEKRGKEITKLKEIITLLTQNEILPLKNRNHKLKGNYQNYWECHIEPDWLLIYKLTSSEIILVRTGSHSDLF